MPALLGRLLFSRQGTCPRGGGVYYKCQANGFNGCCSKDPCAYPSGDPCGDAERDALSREQGDDGDDPTPTAEVTDTESTITTTIPNPSKTTKTVITETTIHGSTITSSVTVQTVSVPGLPSTASIPTLSLTSTATPTFEKGGTASPTGTISSATSIASAEPSRQGSERLSTASIAGISIGATTASLVILSLVFLLARRRYLAKGMASLSTHRCNDHPAPIKDEKSRTQDSQVAISPIRERGDDDDDVFSQFGGRFDTPSKLNRTMNRTTKTNIDQHWPLRSIEEAGNSATRQLTAGATTANPQSRGYSNIAGAGDRYARGRDNPREERTGSPSPKETVLSVQQLDSRPVYVELDSGDTEGLVSLPSSDGTLESIGCGTSKNMEVSPISDPRTSSTWNAAAGDMIARNQAAFASNNRFLSSSARGGNGSNRDNNLEGGVQRSGSGISTTSHPSPLTPGQAGTQMSTQGPLRMTRQQTQQSSSVGGDSNEATPDRPRATLNPSDGEREKGVYATSWAQGP